MRNREIVDGNGFWLQIEVEAGSWSVIRKEKCDDWPHWLRRLTAWFWRIMSPGFGRCGACGLPWVVVSSHSTDYSDGRGMFPLCERCWRESEPEERLHHYRTLWEEWEDDHPGYADWEQIENAVLSEKNRSSFQPQEGFTSHSTSVGHGLSSSIGMLPHD